MLRSSKHLSLSLSALLLFATVPPALARQPEIGARPLAMGETFLAIADDGNTLLWNPAGLPSIGHHELISSAADLYGMGIKANNLGYLFPLRERYALGFDWNHLASEDPEFGYQSDSFRLSYGHKVWRELSLGVAARYISNDMTLDGSSLGQGAGWSYDLAGLYKYGQRLKVALAVRDLSDARVRYKDRSGTDVIDERRFRVGVSYRPLDGLLVASDLDDQFHLGAEYWYRELLALRAGIQKDLDTDEPSTFSAGLGMRYKFVKFDYTYVMPPTLSASSRISLALYFDLYPSKVRIVESPTIKPIFPAFYRRYAGADPVTNVKLINQDSKPHQATLSFFVPELMAAPAEKQFVILPKETKEIALDQVVFASKITEETEPRMVQAEVSVSYATEQKTRNHKKRPSLFVYGRNNTQWDDVRKAAAFITPQDPLVEAFTHPVLVAHEDEIKALGKSGRNLMRAMVLFEAVKQHGVRYIADANSPYAQKAGDKEAVDDIQYPAEVLLKKSGDCDDLTALYCALLENARVSTALVDYPGHIFMLFDTGIPHHQAYRLPVGEAFYLVRGDRLWIPVEITLFGKSFHDAWHAGVDELSQLSREERRLRIKDTADAWLEYEPAGPKFAGQITPPAQKDFGEALLTERTTLEGMIDAFISTTYLEPLKTHPEDQTLRRDLAKAYVSISRYGAALEQYQQLLTAGDDQGKLYNNMGIASFLGGQMEQAADYFRQSVALRPDDEEVKRNHDRAMMALGREERLAATREGESSEVDAAKGDEVTIDEDSFYWRE